MSLSEPAAGLSACDISCTAATPARIESKQASVDDILEHQLRNLLSIIIGYATLMGESLTPDDARRQDLQEILTAAEQAVALLAHRDASGD